MDTNKIANQFAVIIYGRIDAGYLSSLLNAATLNDISNLDLNEDEQKAYNMIMSSRQVDIHLNDNAIMFSVNYDSVRDPGNFLPVLIEGQAAPEITGTVHLPQGGERPTNVKFWYPGQVYEEGAKDPIVFPENDNRLLAPFAEEQIRDVADSNTDALGEIVAPELVNELQHTLGGGNQ